MKTIAIIQARMGSTRLPGKVLMPLQQTKVLAYCVERAKMIKHVSEVIVATTDLLEDDVIVKWCDNNGVRCFRGAELDVLARFAECAKQYTPDYVIRLTSDNPFVDYEVASNMLKLIQKETADVAVTQGRSILGFGSEIVSYSTLLNMHEHGKEEHHREHVTSYAYEKIEQFKVATYQLPYSQKASEIRLTLDTAEDYELIQAVAKHFNDVTVKNDGIISYLIDEAPQLLKLNAHIIQKTVK